MDTAPGLSSSEDFNTWFGIVAFSLQLKKGGGMKKMSHSVEEKRRYTVYGTNYWRGKFYSSPDQHALCTSVPDERK